MNPLKWKVKDEQGKYISYKRGDIVSKNGKLYLATRRTNVRHGSPEHGAKAGWKEYTENRITKYTDDSSAPLDPLIGDEWYDTSVGKLFKWVDDGNSTQWVEF